MEANHPANFQIIDTVPGKAKPFIKGHDPLDDVEVDDETAQQVEDIWNAINGSS